MGIWKIKTLKLVLIIADAIFMVIMSSLSLALIFVLLFVIVIIVIYATCVYMHIIYV